MICQRCGTYTADDALTCDNCGTLLSDGSPRLRETGVRAMRQGRQGAAAPVLPDETRQHVPEYGDYEMTPMPLPLEQNPRRKAASPGLGSFASRPATRRGVPVNPRGRARTLSPRQTKTHHVSKRPINWMLIGMVLAALAVAVIASYLIYMRGTDEGQRITARRIIAAADESLLALAQSKDELIREQREEALSVLQGAPAHSYWLIGQEYIDVGDVVTAIRCFRVADILDPENYDGLLLLAGAYELDAVDVAAEEIYLRLMNDIAPSRTEAYAALIRLYLNQERNPEAADLMRKAYDSTEQETYRLQRKEFIPLTPQVDLAAGRYELEQTVNLTSPEGYDIYYTLDDEVPYPVLGVIPEGWHYTEDGSLRIQEGTKTLRAFCLKENLVSDPLSVTYTVFYPTPSAPNANLAPNTYKKALTVSLRPNGKEDEKEYEEGTLTFYYTIDGSTPTTDSPVFDGTPIKLPSGRVVLRAMCVNKYGKASSIREVGYKFDIKPYPLPVYSREDRFSGFTLNQTSIEQFKNAFGQPETEAETQYLYMENSARILEYKWGSAVFILEGTAWHLVRVDMDSEVTGGPRGVGFGDSEAEVTAAYKDMGQVQAPNGNRGLYYADPDIGSILQNPDGTRTVQYACTTLDSKTWILQYHLRGDRVYRISHFYQP